MGKNGGRMGIYGLAQKVKKVAYRRVLGSFARTTPTQDARSGSIVECGAQDGGDEMGEVRSAVVELQIANNTVVGEIFGYASFRDAKMIGETRLDGFRAAAAGGAAKKTANSDAQGLAGFDVVVGGKIGIAEKQHSGADWSAVGFI